MRSKIKEMEAMVLAMREMGIKSYSDGSISLTLTDTAPEPIEDTAEMESHVNEKTVNLYTCSCGHDIHTEHNGNGECLMCVGQCGLRED